MHILAMIIFMFSRIELVSVHAPELVSVENSYRVQANGYEITVIPAGPDWVSFISVGEINEDYVSGKIYCVYNPIGKTDMCDAPIEYFLIEEKEGRQLGKITFRGHDRKICVSISSKQLLCQ